MELILDEFLVVVVLVARQITAFGSELILGLNTSSTTTNKETAANVPLLLTRLSRQANICQFIEYFRERQNKFIY